jgi:coenzyme PQQ biosynthesis protein PqqD
VDALSDKSRPGLARGVRLSTDKKTGEPLLLFPEGVVHLSATANAILQHCDGQATVGEIASALAADFDADPGIIREDVLKCLSQLHRRKLVMLT